jgi:hydrogenase maturation protease
MSGELLVIGYGNELRRDDGVGPRAARVVSGWGRPGTRTLAVPQLTPELAGEVAAAAEVIFVDADLAGEAVRLRTLLPADDGDLGHAGGPRGLLALAAVVYGRAPSAWLLTVPAADLGFGEALSAAGERGLAAALRHLDRLTGLTSAAGPRSARSGAPPRSPSP